jgi:DeoR/GlpR family transcriptional regulator of sugar metabolism
MIDIGTTTLTVITSNLAVMEELVPDESIELVVLGGIVWRNFRSLVGVLAEDALRPAGVGVVAA